jgi:hypothetical protein
MLRPLPLFAWLTCALVSGCDPPMPSGVLQDESDLAVSAGDDLAITDAGYVSPRRDGDGDALPDLSTPAHDLAGGGPDLAGPPVDDHACDTCEQQQCRNVDGIDWYALCFLDDTVISDGPGSGKKFSQLCLDVLHCARETGCAAKDPQVCYCGDGVSDTICLGMPQGPCRDVFEAAAETTHVSDVIDRLVDPTYPVGAAFNLLRYCEIPICGASCGGSGGAHADGGAPADLASTPHDLASAPQDLAVAPHDLATAPDLAVSCPDLDNDGKPDCTETLVQNPRFDVDIAGWTAEYGATAAWQAPGVILVTNTVVASANGVAMAGASQCIAATGGAGYRLFVQARLGGDGGAAAIAAQLFPSTDCSGNAASAWTSPTLSTAGAWTTLQGSLTAPATARSMRVRLVALKQFSDPAFAAQFDNPLVVTP